MTLRSSVKQAELLSNTGAAVMGAGLGLLLERWVKGWGLALLLAGIAAHAFGMYRKRSLEISGGATRAGWEEVLYWLCWVGLVVLLAIIGLRP